MRCNEFRSRLNELLDSRRAVSEDAELSRHAAGCPVCTQALKIADSFLNLGPRDDAYGKSTEQELSRTPTDKLDVYRHGTSRTLGLKSLGFVAAVAASVALVVNMLPTSSSDEHGGVANVNTQPEQEQVAITAIEEIEADTFLPVAGADTPAFVYQPLISIGILSAHDWDYAVEEVPIPFGGKLQIEPRWIEVVSNGMAPVQSSVSKTISAIRRSLSS